MVEFRTIFKIPENKQKINFQSKILSLGSCFSENIGTKLSYYKFPVVINPFGILYNPESIANSLEFLQNSKLFKESEMFENEGVWNSFYHHSRFSNTNKKEALTQINNFIQKASQHLKETKFLLLTFGTAWVYKHKNTGKIVSNCHKISEKEFIRFKLSVDEIVERYVNLVKNLKNQNPNLNIIFTVSPVRHLKDGASENQLSKATLIMAIHKLIAKFENVSYFPSYEIMMDDLRDYRFYNEDMVHPSPIAINYIWEKFLESNFHSDAKKLMVEIHKINKALEHRPFQLNSVSHQKFLKSTLSKIETIESKNATLKFTEEKSLILQQLIQT